MLGNKCGSQEHFKTHNEIGRGKRPMHRNMLPQKKVKNTLLVFKKGKSCTDKLHIKWTGLNKAGGEGRGDPHVKTSASTLIAGEV